MGLASAYGIIRNHDGFIDVYSEIKKGTTFIIYVPASDHEAIAEQISMTLPVKGNETILLVDDEPIVMDVGRNMLEHLGYHVISAHNGREAVQKFDEHQDKVDLVILDMVMPGMGGRKTFERLRICNPNIKVLLSSGYSIDGQARRILDNGCNGFIQKPFTMAKLSQKIREVIDGCA